MSARKTRQQPRPIVVLEREGVRITREAGEYRAYVYGIEVGAGYSQQHQAEQAANDAMYQMLNQQKAA